MKSKKILSYVLASSMCLTLFAGMTFTANAQTVSDENETSVDSSSNETLQELLDNFSSGFNEDGSVDTSVYDFKEGSDTENLSTLSEVNSLESFDLRHVGGTISYDDTAKKNVITGGKSYVTSVKNQGVWGTCWAFGTIAASESSILYELNEGTEEVDNDNIDLSEHHLAWFGKNHIPAEGEEGYGTNDVNNQDGEGIYYTGQFASKSMDGGVPFCGTSVFAAGMGVETEEFAPYWGVNKGVCAVRNDGVTKYTDPVKYYDTWAMWEAEEQDVKDNYSTWYYSPKDDWSLDESKRFNQEYALEESNILPDVQPVKDSETGETVLNEDGINAVKAELLSGKGVAMAYCSDGGNGVGKGDTRYINTNYAQYCWDSPTANHAVCIVGWDDDYDASNFGQENAIKKDKDGNVIYKLKDSDQEVLLDMTQLQFYYLDKDGNRVVVERSQVEAARETDSSITVPKGNGAWIVKNSWGDSDNENPNYSDWGIDGTGYFYLSYYDTSICLQESFDFAVTDEEQEEYDYSLIDEYDFMPAATAGVSEAVSPAMMANVFTASEDMEIEAVSCETATPGTTVTYALALMDDDDDYPSQAEEFNYLGKKTYDYGGYHRLELDNPVVVSKGQKYAVIAIESYSVDGQQRYAICSNTSYSKEYAESKGMESYFVGIINPGESYICTYAYNSDNLIWTDYYNFVSQYKTMSEENSDTEFDNFSIKVYGSPTTKAAPVLKSAVNTKTGVKVSWESKGTGYDYRLFMKESGTSKWDVVADTESTSYLVTGLTAGTSYDFTVCCMAEDGMSYLTSYDKTGVSCTYLPYVNLKAKAVSSGIKLSWSKTSGASGYNIYRKSETSDYKLIGTIYNNSKVSYQDTTAKQGMVYTYKVRAFSDSSESASKTVSKVILKTPTLKVSSTKSKTVTVKWSKNTKATGYQIKYRVGSKIKVVKVKNAATVKKVLKKLKKGKICKVKVRSYKTVSGKTYFSNWSKLKKIKIK